LQIGVDCCHGFQMRRFRILVSSLALLTAPCFTFAQGGDDGGNKSTKVDATKLVFVINTTEADVMGPATATYLDETRWRKIWNPMVEAQNASSTLGPKVQVVTIRASSNEAVTRALALWLHPLPTDTSPREVLGIAVYSHGSLMEIFNESDKFRVRLPDDVAKTFAPVVGRFPENARILFFGCNLLEGKSEASARTALQGILSAFEIKSGAIYANSIEGLDPHTLFVSPLNPDVKPLKRTAAFISYLIWPFTSVIVPTLSRFYFNQGYSLAVRADGSSTLWKSRYGEILKAQ